jgi:hypothetical protein
MLETPDAQVSLAKSGPSLVANLVLYPTLRAVPGW